MNEILNRSFKKSYTTNCYIFALVLFWLVNIQMQFLEDAIGALSIAYGLLLVCLFNFGFSVLVFIKTLILGIIVYKKEKEAKIRKKTAIMLSVLGVLHIIALVVIVLFWT